MKQNLIKLAVVATLGLSAFTASADDMYRGAWYVVPSAAYMHTDKDLDAKNGPGVSLKIGKELSESWDVQGGIGYNTAKQDLRLGLGESGRYRQTTLGLDALYMFSRSSFRPFLLAGAGYARNDLDYSIPGFPVDGKKNSWLGNVGLGAQYLVNDSFGLQADIRQQWSRAKVQIASVGSDSGSISNTLLNIGGIIRFGAPAPVVAVVEPAPVVEPTPAPAVEPTPEPAVEAAPAPQACKPTLETVTVSAEKLFGFDKYKLQEGAKPILDETVAKIKANPELKAVIVTGHTDRIGSTTYNQKLSEKRAAVVKEYLVSQGVDASIISSVGKGESEPVEACKGVKGKKLISCLQPNRRVVISGEATKEVGCN